MTTKTKLHIIIISIGMLLFSSVYIYAMSDRPPKDIRAFAQESLERNIDSITN